MCISGLLLLRQHLSFYSEGESLIIDKHSTFALFSIYYFDKQRNTWLMLSIYCVMCGCLGWRRLVTPTVLEMVKHINEYNMQLKMILKRVLAKYGA